MMIPSRRKLGAAALIIAGIGAFMVPFLLHPPSTQGTSNNNNGGTNPNNGSHTTTPTPTTPTPTTPTNPTCSEDKAKDPSPSDNGNGQHKGNAWGVLKNQMDTTVAVVKAMGTHNTAFHLHHDTKTDNDTVHAHPASSESSNDHDSSCAEKEETNED
jgi:hypothetical protein